MNCPPVDILKLAAAWDSEMRSDEICEAFGLSRGGLYRLAHKHRLGRRPVYLNGNGNCATDDPTPAQIAERAAAIRATWTPNERASRMVGCRRGRVEIKHFLFDREGYAFSAGQ